MATAAPVTAPVDLPRGTAPRFDRVPLDLVDTADNVRTTIDPAADQELADSIRELGILQPVTLTETGGGRYLVRMGHRRVRCARLAGLTAVDALIESDPAPGSRVLEQLVENIERADLTPLEEAHALRRILDGPPKVTQAALATRFGWDPSTLANKLSVLRLPDDVQQLMAAGSMALADGKALAGLPPAEQSRLAKEKVTGAWSSHTLEQQARYVRDRQADLVKRAKASEAAGARAVAALREAAVETTTPVTVSAGWQFDHEAIVRAVATAGFHLPEAALAWTRSEGCDCGAVRVVVQDGKGSSVEPVCVSDAHRARMEAAARAERDAAAETRRQERRAMIDALEASLRRQPADPAALRLILRAFDSYAAKPWTEYAAMSDDDVIVGIVRRAMPESSYGAPDLPARSVLKALGGRAVTP